MGLFRRLRGGTGPLAQARSAELRGDLSSAAELFVRAGRPDEAARVMILRGDAETDIGHRLQHYAQARELAPDDSSMHTRARRKHAYAVLALAEEGPIAGLRRRDLMQAASELESLGDHKQAAEAYARLGDLASQARVLALAGEVDALDTLLVEQQRVDREAAALRNAHDEVSLLSATGRRREAVALARTIDDPGLRERARRLEAARIAQGVVPVTLLGNKATIVMGEEVMIGRAVGPHEGISVASPAVSRKHVSIQRRGGAVLVRDIAHRNTTLLRGLPLSGEAPVGAGIELSLGGQVPLVVSPSSELPGALAIDISGVRYVAPLGPAMLGIGRWRLERGSDGWVELVTDDEPPAFHDSMQLFARITLVAGDAISRARSSAPVLELGRDGS